MKQKIMEALLESENLTREEILWAESHLPFNNKKGDEKPMYVFNHDKDDTFSAIGLTKEEIQEASDFLTNITRDVMTKEGYGMSHAVEKILDNVFLHKGLIPIITARTIKGAVEEVNKMLLSKFLEK